jgi:hypothetical protein
MRAATRFLAGFISALVLLFTFAGLIAAAPFFAAGCGLAVLAKALGAPWLQDREGAEGESVHAPQDSASVSEETLNRRGHF